MRSSKTQIIVRTSLFIAMIFLATFFIKFPVLTGYLNVGDSLILLSTMFLPPVASILAGGIGAAIADIASGAYAIFAPFTFVIKGIEALIFIVLFAQLRKCFGKRQCIAYFVSAFIALLWMVIGYFFAYYFISLDWGYALASSLYDLIQFGGSLIISTILFASILKIKAFDENKILKK